MRTAAVLALILLASACATSTPPATAPPAPPVVTTPPATTALATAPPVVTTTPATTTLATAAPVVTTTPEPPAAPSGTVVVGPGQPIQVRVLQAISGAAEPLGLGQVRGVELALTDFGPVHGHPVEIGEARDDLCSHDGGVAESEAIAAEPDVVAVIGPSCSGAAVPAARILGDAGMPLISASTTVPELTSDTRGMPGGSWRPGYFRTSPNDARQAITAAHFAHAELGAVTAGALHTGDPYTVTLAETFATVFRELGGEAAIVRCKPCRGDEVDAALAELAAGAPDALFLPVFRPEGDLVLAAYRSVPGLEDASIVAGDGLLDDELLAAPETAGMYLVTVDRRLSGNLAATGVSHDDYLGAFAERYGGPPPTLRGYGFDASAYDATLMLLAALADVADIQGDSLVIDRTRLRARLHATSGLGGLTGTVACDRFGDCNGQPLVVLRHDDPADPAATRANVVHSLPPPPPDSECHPAVTETGSVIGPEARLRTIYDVEAWALIFPHGFAMGQGDPVRLPARMELKIVFRITGPGDPAIAAVGPGGLVVAPTDGPDRHEGSNWRRPGEEYGTGWVLPEPGCWTFRIRRDGKVAALVAEAFPT